MAYEAYPTDMSNERWKIFEPLIPPAKSGGRPRTTDMREVVNAILYRTREGGEDIHRCSRRHWLGLMPALAAKTLEK